MKTKPILFSTEMVRALLDGRKSVTRRVVKPQPPSATHPQLFVDPPYRPGDILYVRETWKRFCGMLYGRENGTYIPLDDFEGYKYKADEQCVCTKGINPFCDGFEDQKNNIRFDDKWHPSIHMPKEAARLFLRVTDVRVERLHDMQPYDIAFEGFRRQRDFIALWDRTIKKADLPRYSWAANPWVFVISFERITKDEAMQ